MVSGDKRHQMLGLKVDGELALAAGNSAVPLAEFIDYEDGVYSFDGDAIRQLVDSATTADPRYTASNARGEARKLDTQAKYERWQKAYRELEEATPEHVRCVVLEADSQAGHRGRASRRDYPQAHEEVNR